MYVTYIHILKMVHFILYVRVHVCNNSVMTNFVTTNLQYPGPFEFVLSRVYCNLETATQLVIFHLQEIFHRTKNSNLL
jgi:hypothetical protein